eukprot:scaffold153277_cov26-Attheya_sp.AAC.2
MYVSGPPGCGKTSFFLLYAAQWHRAHTNQRGLVVVQYRDLTTCDIMIIENNEIKRVSKPVLSTENLLSVLKEMIKADKNFAFFMFDGVQQNVEKCKEVLAFLNANFMNGLVKGIHITSLQFNVKGGDGTGGLNGIDEFMSIHSWKKTTSGCLPLKIQGRERVGGYIDRHREGRNRN